LKIDLHLHSPASKCFKDNITPDIADKMVQKAIDVGLTIIGITDHHTVDFMPDIQKAASSTSLTVWPGVELSFVVGDYKNIYLLAYFPENTPVYQLNRMLDEWGIPNSAKGDCNYRMATAIDRVIGDVRKCGGIIISGHIDKDEARKSAIPLLVNDYGIEQFDLKYSHTAQEIQKQFPQPIQCFTFSDSHRIANIGSRYSEINSDLEIVSNLSTCPN
jgi:PHP family Zn ribbon phosphoesterase